jgi:proteasome accessory factor C
VSEPAWVRSLVLGSGGQVEVISPGWLTESIRRDAERALEAYSAK